MNCPICFTKYENKNVNGEKFDYKFLKGITMKQDCEVLFCGKCNKISNASEEIIEKAMEKTVKKDKMDFFLNSLILLMLYIMSVANLFWMYSLMNPEIQYKVNFIISKHPNEINFNWHLMQGKPINYALSAFSLWFLFYCGIITYKAIKKVNVEYQKSWLNKNE